MFLSYSMVLLTNLTSLRLTNSMSFQLYLRLASTKSEK